MPRPVENAIAELVAQAGPKAGDLYGRAAESVRQVRRGLEDMPDQQGGDPRELARYVEHLADRLASVGAMLQSAAALHERGR